MVNYDIHWHPVRIIQRFGRVDRIGTKNASVKLAEKKAESDVESLFNSTETSALSGDCAHLDAFELIAFFVLKEAKP